MGEEALIELLVHRLTPRRDEVWSGDDAAVVTAPSGRLLFTTDTMVEGADFDLSYCSGEALGWKVLTINVSDVAAMGGRPSKALTTMCLPPETGIRFVESFVEGLVQASSAYDVDLVGGDISSATQLTIGVALLGSCERPPWLRSGARVGEALCVTGALGGSRAGFDALQADSSASGPAVERHLRPQARLAEAAALHQANVSAAIDISDGLVIDLHRMMRASGTGCEVDQGSIPIDEAASGRLDAALYGGEDFELLLALPEDEVEAAIRAVDACGTTLTRIGEVTGGAARIGPTNLKEMEERSWDHLRSP